MTEQERMLAEVMAEPRVYEPVTPGSFIETEFLEPLEITAYALAQAIGVRPPRVYEIVRGNRAITADTALRFARYFGTTPEYWLRLQNHYDIQRAEIEAGDTVQKIEPLAVAERR